jgi:hypothetical protein
MKVWDGIGVLGMTDTLGPPLKVLISSIKVHSETRLLKGGGFSDIKDSRRAPSEIVIFSDEKKWNLKGNDGYASI